MNNTGFSLRRSIKARFLVVSFFYWWTRNLGHLLPRALKKAFSGNDEKCFIFLPETERQPWVYSDKQSNKFPMFDSDGNVYTECRNYLNSAKHIDLIVSSMLVFRRSIDLPSAARHQLGDAVSFLIDKISPLPGNDVYFSARPLAGNASKTTVRAEVALIPKADIDRCIEFLLHHKIWG